MNEWRHYLDVTVAVLTALVALYYRVDRDKRLAFEKAYPRLAALIGVIAGIIPFAPMIVDNAKRLLTPAQPTPIAPTDVPQAPWSESTDEGTKPHGE